MKQIKLIIILLALSTTLSAQWEQVDSIPEDSSPDEILYPYNNELYYFGSLFIYMLDESTDNFIKLYNTEEFIRCFEIENDIIYWCENEFVLMSDDKCETIDTILEVQYGSCYSIAVDNESIYIGASYKIYISNDNGDTWEEKEKPYYYSDVYSFLKLSESNFFVGCLSNAYMYLYETTDNMETWNLIFSEEIYNGKDDYGYHDIKKVGYNEIVYTVLGYPDLNRFLYSFDNGYTYNEIDEFDWIRAYENINNQTVLVIGIDLGFLEYEYKLAVSSGYENFAIYDLPFVAVDIAKFNDYLYAVDYQGRVFRTNLANHVDISEENTNFYVEVFPNPATSVINIECNNKINNILIYNTLGQIVKQGNNYSYNQINVSNLPSGVYILNIQTETESISRKIIKK